MSCSRFIQFLQAHTSTPERDATSLCSSPVAKCGGNLYFLSIRGIYIQSGIGGRMAGGRIFYKFTSKVLWSRRHLVSWDSWHKVPTNPSEPSVRCERQAAKACLRCFISSSAASVLPPAYAFFLINSATSTVVASTSDSQPASTSAPSILISAALLSARITTIPAFTR